MSKKGSLNNEWEEDYVTRCICGFTHDDGFMICCDECSVWQHIECVQVDPKNLPENYLCEQCSPRAVDKKRARTVQLRKREELTGDGSDEDVGKFPGKVKIIPSQTPQNNGLAGKKKRKQRASGFARNNIRELKKRPKDDFNKTRKTLRPVPDRGSPVEDDSVWSCNSSPWSDPYEVITSSRVTEKLKTLVQLKLAQVKSEATLMEKSSYALQELRQPKCVVVDVQKHRKGVVTETTIEQGTLVMEYKGKYTLRHLVSAELSVPGVSLWKERPCPFLYYYDKISGIDLVVDARSHGNIARFIRRSCSPNCELQHILIDKSDLRLGLYSLHTISPGEEITLPFDFQYNNCDYEVECGCDQRACLLEKGVADKGIGKKKLPERGSVTRLSGDTPIHAKKRRRTTSSLNSPVVISQPVQAEEVEGEEGEVDRSAKKKSREERKLEQYVKMFNSMEASSKRRQDKREEDVDLAKSGRKRSMRPPLLSVDDSTSNDKPYDTMSPDVELTSPLYSIGLVTTLHLSPPPSPPLRPKPKIDFEVGLRTHPGYLFNNFPTTSKKILLARWMSDRQHATVHCKTNQDTKLDTVPLKKRWIRKFYQEEVSSGAVEASTLPVKMRTMMKWKSEQSSHHSTSEDVDPGRQSPLFEDFSDDEDFDCLNDVKPVSREHRVSSGSTSNLPGQRTPNTPPSASPKHGNLLSSPFSTSTSPCLVGVSTSPHLTSVSTASPHPLSLTASPHPLGIPVGSPLESGIKMEAMDIDDDLSRDSTQLTSMADLCGSPGDELSNSATQSVKKKVSLKEYLSRTKKMQEQKKAEDEHPTTEPIVNPSLSLLSKALTSFASSLPSLEKKSNPAAVSNPTAQDHNFPEFEPVSPEEQETI